MSNFSSSKSTGSSRPADVPSPPTPVTPRPPAPPPAADTNNAAKRPPKPPSSSRNARKNKSSTPDAAQLQANDPDEQRLESLQSAWQRFGNNGYASLAVSTLVHLVILVALALILLETKQPKLISIEAGQADDQGLSESLSVMPELSEDDLSKEESWDSPRIEPNIGSLREESRQWETSQTSNDSAAPTSIVGAPVDAPSGLPVGGGWEGRTPEDRKRLAAARGGTEASENAVELGLAWLAAHQRSNGAWWFDHHDGPCNGRCGNPGPNGCSTAATGLALLAFLGAGYTHEQGPYQEEVRAGLYYLMSKIRITQYGGDLREGTMYGQGIATMALCEAVGMTGDEQIRPLAQKAVDYIVNAQHRAGGWRYNPQQQGDTTVTGWQFMALKSAQMAGLQVPTPTIHLAEAFLNSVESGQGAYYGYRTPGKDPSPTAIGLLCRMYSGWRRGHAQLNQGAEYLFELAPSKTDLYFNYYATLVLSHLNGQLWESWNENMRDYLVEQQSQRGHERGSWYFRDRHGDQGGRLYNTAMAIMILEVYYRYLPLYGEDAVEGSW